jgi:hypothetical protein
LNGGDGVKSTQHAVLIDDSASQNTGYGFEMNTSTCYRNLSSYGNTGGPVLSGTPLAGTQAYCN